MPTLPRIDLNFSEANEDSLSIGNVSVSQLSKNMAELIQNPDIPLSKLGRSAHNLLSKRANSEGEPEIFEMGPCQEELTSINFKKTIRYQTKSTNNCISMTAGTAISVSSVNLNLNESASKISGFSTKSKNAQSKPKLSRLNKDGLFIQTPLTPRLGN